MNDPMENEWARKEARDGTILGLILIAIVLTIFIAGLL
jgi:hypothetical protein